MGDDTTLTQEQSKALFDILTHWETYKEIEDFKYPGAIYRYGPPFQDEPESHQSPILQSLLSKVILVLPGLRDISPRFWKTQVEGLIQDLAEADLSESYDKGFLGIRKTLATAIAAFIEYPARGILGGLPPRELDPAKHYDTANPDDVHQSWHDAMQSAIYGDLIDSAFTKIAETDDLTQHSSMVQAVHEFLIVNIASVMHYTIILSPEGQTLIRMLDSVHKLIPYTIIRQTLKIGNVATMISGLLRVVLAKVSVGSVTNWIGLSKGAAEGMNLLQSIISQVLWWDKRELKKRADKIEHLNDAPPKDVREELKRWIESGRDAQEKCRKRSKEEEISIVAAILEQSDMSVDLSAEEHEHALKYLSLHLAVRDRTEIVRVLCHRNPDALTAAIREAVDTYMPLIRQVHEAVNLADGFWDMEQFITDMIKVSKPRSTHHSHIHGHGHGHGHGHSHDHETEQPPSVEDFVDLLHRHAHAVHKFLHQMIKNGPELTSVYEDWLRKVVAQFRTDKPPPQTESVISPELDAGGVKQVMNASFAELSSSDRTTIKQELDAHAKYIDNVHAASAARISAVIRRTHNTPFGPGAYLARWQQHMDSTLVTPATARGPLRHGSDSSVKEEGRKDVDGHESGFVPDPSADHGAGGRLPEMPKSDVTLRLLGPKFRSVLAES